MALADVALDFIDVVGVGVDAGPALEADLVEVGLDGFFFVSALFRGLGGAAVVGVGWWWSGLKEKG